MRRGPYPLTAHIGLAASHAALTDVQNKNLEHTQIRLQNMLLGIQKYQTHSYISKRAKLKTIWQSGEVRLRSLENAVYKKDAPILVLIPSMINKYYVFDVSEKRSFIRWMHAQNINVFILDWGDSLKDAQQHSVHSLVCNKILPALSFCNDHFGEKPYALGYCMGGTLLCGASVLSDDIKGSIFLAAPWDFEKGKQHLRTHIQFWMPSFSSMLNASGSDQKSHLPVLWLQTLFATLYPDATPQKFSKFYQMNNEERESIFVAIEDWLNDGVDLPFGIAQETIIDWFIKNKTGQGDWVINNVNITPSKIEHPVLVVASKKDRLVDFESASIVADNASDTTLIETQCGHIGMIAGHNAIEKAWYPIEQWIIKNHKMF